jgi:hypothetical protein
LAEILALLLGRKEADIFPWEDSGCFVQRQGALSCMGYHRSVQKKVGGGDVFQAQNIFMWNQFLFMAVLNPIFRIVGAMQEKNRNRILVLCWMLLVPIYFVRISKNALPWFVFLSEKQWDIVGCVILFAIIVFSQRRKLRLLEASKWYSIFFYLPPIIIFLSSFDHPLGIGLRTFSLMLMFVFPCLYFVWASRGDFETLFRHLSWALVVSGFVFFVVNALFFFSDGSIVNGRFYGITPNPNSVGVYVAANLLGAFYLFFTTKGKLLVFPVLSIYTGMLLLALALSRTALLAVSAMFIAGVVFECVRQKENVRLQRRVLIKCLALVVVGIGFMVAISSYMIYSGSGLASLMSGGGNMFANLWNRLTASLHAGATIEQFSAYRTSIWKLFLEGLSVRGKDFNIEPVIWNGQPFSAHNTVLEFSYRCGIFAGLFYLLFIVFSLVLIFRSHGKENSHIFLFPMMSGLSFLFYSMLDTVIMPFCYSVILCFFVCVSPLMFRGRANDDKMPQERETT